MVAVLGERIDVNLVQIDVLVVDGRLMVGIELDLEQVLNVHMMSHVVAAHHFVAVVVVVRVGC